MKVLFLGTEDCKALEVHAKCANWFTSVSGVIMQEKVTGIYQIHRKFLVGKYEKSSRRYNVCAAPVLSCMLLCLCFLGALKVLAANLSNYRVFLPEFS